MVSGQKAGEGKKMDTRHKMPEAEFSIVEAVETLSNIADLEYSKDIGVTETHQIFVQDRPVVYRTVHWLHEDDPKEAVQLIKKTFGVVLNYLKDFYKKEYRQIGNKNTIEGIKTIMVLVGEAAKKLDKYSKLFQKSRGKSVTKLQEYKQLQEFYQTKIARRIDEGTLGKWILGLTQKVMAEKEQATKLVGKEQKTDTKHVFIDLDSVKKDTEYELFFLRKEDGTRFFNPRLIRNIKLVCDFGDYFGSTPGEDPFVRIRSWQDRMLQSMAKMILEKVIDHVDRFYDKLARNKQSDLVPHLNKALMALMMAGNSNNLWKNHPVKCCSEYFMDFQRFLRDALNSSYYLKFITYPPKRTNQSAHTLLDLTNALCSAIYSECQGFHEILPTIELVIERAEDRMSPDQFQAAEMSEIVWRRLHADYFSMGELIKMHPSGPLIKVLDLLEQGSYQTFDPMLHFNVPSQLFSLSFDKTKITNLHLPTPTQQEYIHKAKVADEFKSFLRSKRNLRIDGKHLLINFQDRTSWREHFRSIALEELQNVDDFEKKIVVVTLAKDTEFYHQLAPYHEENQAELFKEHLRQHLVDESSGFYFPKAIKKKLFPVWSNKLIDRIHKVFFADRNILTRENRLDFIELVYMFMELKLLELANPKTWSFTCKDGIDVGASSGVQLYVFMKLINNQKLTIRDHQQLQMMLYGPSLLNRERLMLPDRFHRMTSVLKLVENLREEIGEHEFFEVVHKEFNKLYGKHILESAILLPRE